MTLIFEFLILTLSLLTYSQHTSLPVFDLTPFRWRLLSLLGTLLSQKKARQAELPLYLKLNTPENVAAFAAMRSYIQARSLISTPLRFHRGRVTVWG